MNVVDLSTSVSVVDSSFVTNLNISESITGLPEDVNFDEFDNLLRKPDNDKNPYLAITYFCAFLNSSEEVLKLHQRLRFTAYERDLALFLVQHRAATRNVDDLVYVQ